MSEKEEIPDILDAWKEKKDPNLDDVDSRDFSNYGRARHWIKHWSPSNRWCRKAFFEIRAWKELRLKDIGRKLNDPGDAFFRVFYCDPYPMEMTIWAEVTEAFFDQKSAKEINDFIKANFKEAEHGCRPNSDFLKSINSGLPDFYSQKEIANSVLREIEKKVRKGQEGGPYRSLVKDYGRGVLIVGIPFWFYFWPPKPTEAQELINDFSICLELGIKKMEKTILCKKWCPFDSIYVVWDSTSESFRIG